MKRNSLWAFLTIFSAPVLACAFCANAATRDEVMNEKLLNAIRDADVQAVSAAVSGGADANAKPGMAHSKSFSSRSLGTQAIDLHPADCVPHFATLNQNR